MFEEVNMTKRETLIDEVVSDIGSVSETNGLVKNDAALKVEHLLGKKAAVMFGETLEELRNDPQSYSAVFKDKGLRLKAISAIAEKARVTDFPKQPEEVYEQLELFMAYCDTFFIVPTLGLFATWMGASVETFESTLKHYNTTRPETARTLLVAKEVIRGFLETKALDGDIAPAVYLHQNKAYYGAVETAPVKIAAPSAKHVRDREQIAEIIDMLPTLKDKEE